MSIKLLYLFVKKQTNKQTTKQTLGVLAILPHSRVREIGLSAAGHFVQRNCSSSPDILKSCWTFNCKMSGEYQTFRWTSMRGTFVLDLCSPDFLSGEIKPLRWTFFKIRRTCPASPANFAYSAHRINAIQTKVVDNIR